LRRHPTHAPSPPAGLLAVRATDAMGRDAEPVDLPFWIEETPWDWRDSVMYMVVVDRFANGDRAADGPEGAKLRELLSTAFDLRVQLGRLEIDRAARQVRVDGHARTLTSHQFDLLVALAERAGRVLSREQLMDLVRGEAIEAFDRSIDVHISRIRAAIEDDPKAPKRVITVRGAGYLFAKAQD
jgi:hypothetical protein